MPKRSRECTVDVNGLRTPSDVHHVIVPQLQAIFDEDPQSFHSTLVTWDFSSLEPRQINAATLCLFLAVADTVRRRVLVQPTSIFHWKPEVNFFLESCGFFALVRQHDLFSLSTSFTGVGVDVGPAHRPTNRLFAFSPIREEHAPLPDYTSLRSERLELGDAIGRRLSAHKNVLMETIDERVAHAVVKAVVELSVNAVSYSRGKLFGMIQSTGKYISVSLADNGIGLHKGLLNMQGSDDPSFSHGLIWHDWASFAALPPIQRDLAAIIEATCTRATGSGEPGIWDALEFFVAHKRGIGKIHSAQATITFDPHLLTFLQNARKRTTPSVRVNAASEIYNALFPPRGRSPFGRFNSVSNRGTHYDLMFPLTRKV
jgi:hypothetical protein